MLRITDLEDTSEEEKQEYDKPDGSTWIIGVDSTGILSILKMPNIHHGFFDDGLTPEAIGFDEDCGLSPGVYQIQAEFSESHCYETGHVDDRTFSFDEEKVIEIWALEEENKTGK